MKRNKLGQIEHFIRRKLPTKLRNDLRKLRITKEADAECCVYHYLRGTLPADGSWNILARKFSPHTSHYIDLVLLQDKCPRVAIEIKWNRKSMGNKDRRSLNRALREMRVNQAYFITVGPDILESYEEQMKSRLENYHLHEIAVGLGATYAESKHRKAEWKRERNLLGKNMRVGKARRQEFVGGDK